MFGAVTCCSGCFSAYRRSGDPAVARALGEPALPRAPGDLRRRPLADQLRAARLERDATSRSAISRTIVPAHFRLFLRQQLRWKRSWTRESLIVVAVHLAQAPARVRVDLPRDRPAADRAVVALRAIVWMPLIGRSAGAARSTWSGSTRWRSCTASTTGCAHGRYDTLWIFGVVFVFFYLAFLLWQTYYAILTARNPSWGTRSGSPATAAGSS